MNYRTLVPTPELSAPACPAAPGYLSASLEQLLVDWGLESNEALHTAALDPTPRHAEFVEQLYAHGLVAREVLEQAEREQEAGVIGGDPLTLGEICVSLGWLQDSDLRSLSDVRTSQARMLELLLESRPLERRQGKADEQRARAARPAVGQVPVEPGRLRELSEIVSALEKACTSSVTVRSGQHEEEDPNALVARHVSQLRKVVGTLCGSTLEGTLASLSCCAREASRRSRKCIRLTVTGADVSLEHSAIERLTGPLEALVELLIEHAAHDHPGSDHPGSDHGSRRPVFSLCITAADHEGEVILELRLDQHDLGQDFEAADQDALDALRLEFAGLRGALAFESSTDSNATATVRFSRRATTLDVTLIQVNGRRFVLPSDSVVGVSSDADTLVVDGKGLRLEQLAERLGLEGGATRGRSAIALRNHSGTDHLALAVDEILGREEIAVRELGRGAPRLAGINGGVILGDGRVALLLDVDAIFS